METENLFPQKEFAFYALFILLSTLVFGTIYTVAQQNIRTSANDPQIQIAEDMAEALNNGSDTTGIFPVTKIDIAKSLAPFVIIFDTNGKTVMSSGFLDGKIPVPPNGVFTYTSQVGEDRITWQPAQAIRIAAVITKYNGGFVLAGRSLREIEKREDQVFYFAGFAWLASIALLGGFVYLKRTNL